MYGDNSELNLNVKLILQKHLRELCAGMKGVIVTCNGMEKLCVTDAYRLFNEVCLPQDMYSSLSNMIFIVC